MQEKIYSLKSDVWAYGIMVSGYCIYSIDRLIEVWEIYANGSEPYPGLNRMATRAKIVVQDYRMEMPKVGTLQ